MSVGSYNHFVLIARLSLILLEFATTSGVVRLVSLYHALRFLSAFSTLLTMHQLLAISIFEAMITSHPMLIYEVNIFILDVELLWFYGIQCADVR